VQVSKFGRKAGENARGADGLKEKTERDRILLKEKDLKAKVSGTL